MMQRLHTAFNLFTLGLALGVGVSEKIRLTWFLFVGRLVKGKGIVSQAFKIWCLGTPVTVHVRNNFADAFILNEVFRQNEYSEDLPTTAPETIFDVGANLGLVTVYLKVRYPEAQIYCFEPDPENFAQLVLNTKDLQGVTCYQIAIANANGTMKFYQSPLFHMRNSLLPVENGNEIEVETVTLEESLSRTGEEKIDLLKFDVEGGKRDIFTPEAPYSKVVNIIGELHPYRMESSEYGALMSRLKEHFTLELRTEGKKVFVYGATH